MNDVDIFDVAKPKLKLFGERATRVTTAEMNAVFSEIQSMFSKSCVFRRMNCSKPLPSKEDHGDIDITVENMHQIDTKKYIENTLKSFPDHNYLIEQVNNGPIMHCLFFSKTINKNVHVDFIFANSEEYDSSLMYLNYSDFSGIIGVIARKLKFNYSNKGFYKIYIDKKRQFHYIRLTRSLVEGLQMMGYADIMDNYYKIQNNTDVANFIGYSDLFDSKYLLNCDLNRGDRKRLRITRPTARDCRNKLIDLNKTRTQLDDDYYFKLLFPEYYQKYLIRCDEIESFVPHKSKYNGNFIKLYFPNIAPGPFYKTILLKWSERYGDNLDFVSESELIEFTKQIIKS